MQDGHIFPRHGSWHLRYRLNGEQVSQKLAPICDQYRTKKSVRPLADKLLKSINEGRETGPQTLQVLVESKYLPHIKDHRRPSTYKGYINLYNAQIASRIAGKKLGTFRTVDAQKLLDQIAAETELSHRSLIHIKTLLSGIFAYAKRMGFVDANPVIGTEVPKGKETGPTYAYKLEEIEKIVSVLDGAAKMAVLLAAWTGLSLAELRGLQWADIEGDTLTVRRNYWHRHEGPPKTTARQNAVPLLPVVQKTLKQYRNQNALATTWVFEGPQQTPLDLATLGSKRIKAVLEEAGLKWHGWHALRRGFATNLYAAGIDQKTVQSLMRHGSYAVTAQHYVKPVPEVNKKAIEKLSRKRKNREE